MNLAVNLFLSASNHKKGALLIAAGLLFFSSSAQHQLRGMIFEDERYNTLPLPLHYGKTEEVPLRATLQPYLPRVITQASSNTAVAWSVVWYAHTIAEAIRQGIKNSENRHAKLPLSPAFTYCSIQKKEEGCAAPVSLVDALESFQKQGAPRFSDYPEFCATDPSSELSAMAASHKLQGYVRLFNTYDTKDTRVHAIKKALASGSPVVIGIICPPSFQFAGEFWQPREEIPLASYGGHAMCIYGYNDEKFGGSFAMVNSWGTRWGKDGITWVRYEDLANHVKYAFQLLSPPMPLEAAVTFMTGDGSPMPVSKNGESSYAITKTYKTGDAFQLSVRTRKGIFCGVVAVDAAGQAAKLFPGDTLTNPYVSASLTLPNSSEFYTLTEPAGKNKLHFIFAASQLMLEQTLSQVMKGKADYSVDLKLIKWVDNVIQFESTAEAVVVSVELDQR